MTEILLYDYVSVDEWGWQDFNCIGSGRLSAQSIVQQIVDAGDDDLKIKINSVGGSVFDGFAIYNALKAAPGRKEVRIEGLAASIASVIAMAGDEITICQAAMIMIHKPTIDIFWCGNMNADDLQREANALTQIEAVLNDIYATRTGLSATKIANMINAETWLTPDMALTLGFSDSIEKTITEPAEITQPAFNHLFKNANQNIKAYANSAFKIKNMSNPNEALINAVTEQTKTTNSLLDKFSNWFNNIASPKNSLAKNASATLANGNAIYYKDEDTLIAGTQVFADPDYADPLADDTYELEDATTMVVVDGVIESVSEQFVNPTNDAEIQALRDELVSTTAALNSASSALEAANAALEKVQKVKSAYTPPAAKTEFNKPTDKVEEAMDSKDMVERYKQRKQNKK